MSERQNAARLAMVYEELLQVVPGRLVTQFPAMRPLAKADFIVDPIREEFLVRVHDDANGRELVIGPFKPKHLPVLDIVLERKLSADLN